jgi:hypothetical protein
MGRARAGRNVETKPVSLRIAAVLAVSVILTVFLVVTAPPPTSAITRTDATKPFFLEPTKFQNNETWSGVGQVIRRAGFSSGHGSGALISPCHVLTAAHVFFGSSGKGDRPPNLNEFTFKLVTGEPAEKDGKLDLSGLESKEFKVAKIDINPGYNMKLGHRIDPGNPTKNLTRNDIAVITLAERVPDKIGNTAVEIYAINQGEITDERDPGLITPAVPKATLKGAGPGTTANAVKVGFGQAGNGEGDVSSESDPLKREMFNIVNAFGNGMTNFANPTKPDYTYRDNPPPLNTLVYDFDAPTPAGAAGVNSSKLVNTFGAPNALAAPNFSVGQLEGSGAPGDSGGPMFQYKDSKRFITGVTSSSSDTLARYGTVIYDTQVQKYAVWIKSVVSKTNDFANPDCPPARPGGRGAADTSTQDGTDQYAYAVPTDVYLSDDPGHGRFAGLPDGTYYYQVTDRNDTLLSTDIALCRQLIVSGGSVAGATGPPCKHANGSLDTMTGILPVQLYPFAATPNGLYKAWLIRQTANTSISTSDPRVVLFAPSDAKTDDFKVDHAMTPPPPGSCQGSASLTVLLTGRNVVAYIPKGAWSTQATGVSAINVEGSGVTPVKISTPNVVNSCASNPLTGQTVCTANNTDVYLISGTTLGSTLTSGGSGSISFSGGSCTNCGVAIDASHNRAAIGLSVAGAPGFQFLSLGTSPSFEPPFASPAGAISEDPLLDPERNLVLSATESNDFEIVDAAPGATPAFFEHTNIAGGGELDSTAEECSTGIALAPSEFASPSSVFIADLTQATFTPGSPAGTWTAPSQVQSLAGSVLSAGASGSAIAQDTHTGVLAGEFGGDALTAIALPTTSGSGTPAISNWMTCHIGGGFANGLDPHTVTAYQSPNTGDAIALLANQGATMVAVVDLTQMLALPQAGSVCTAGTLPTSVVHFIAVP